MPTYKPGAFLVTPDGVGVLFDFGPRETLNVHLLDAAGATLLRPAAGAEAACPQTGNARSHVTDDRYYFPNEVRMADWSEVPEARRPQPEE